MKILIEENYENLSKKSAEIVAAEIKAKPDLILGLASGTTILGLYQELIKKYQNKELDFSQVKTFNLDEYVGLNKDDPKSYHSFMNRNLFSQINIDLKNTFFPPAEAKDSEAFEQIIKEKGGIDLQILGLGHNGHIAFNEPGSSFETRTRIVVLTPATLQDNAKFFENGPDKVPKKAATMGIATIMEAKKIVLLASGKEKAKVVSAVIRGPITESTPASILQKHPRATILLDKQSANLLETK